MTEKIRFYIQIGKNLIPVSPLNRQKVMDGFGINSFEDGTTNPTNRSVREYTAINSRNTFVSYGGLSTSDIVNHILDNPGIGHSVQSIAKRFMVDIGEGTSKKSKEQIRAYNKTYSNFITARKRIEREQSGSWLRVKAGIKNQIIVWYFNKNMTGA